MTKAIPLTPREQQIQDLLMGIQQRLNRQQESLEALQEDAATNTSLTEIVKHLNVLANAIADTQQVVVKLHGTVTALVMALNRGVDEAQAQHDRAEALAQKMIQAEVDTEMRR